MQASALMFKAPRFDGEFDLRGRADLARDSPYKAKVFPMMELLEHSLGRPIRLRSSENNTQCLQVVETGVSPDLRHLPRTERIFVEVVVVHKISSKKD